MPESARWLIANGKLEQAQYYLRKCAKMNQIKDVTDTLKTEVSIFQRVIMQRALTNQEICNLLHKTLSIVTGIFQIAITFSNLVIAHFEIAPAFCNKNAKCNTFFHIL